MVRNGKNRTMEQVAKQVYENETSRDREVKVAQLSVPIQRVSATVSSLADLHELMPQIPNGTGEGERIGDQIMLQKLVIKTVVTGDFSIGVNSAVSNFLVRDLILRDRSQAGSVLLIDDTNFNYNNILELSQPIVGTLMDQLIPINRTAYATRQDKSMKISMPTNTPNWASPGASPQGVQMYTNTLTFGKGLKLDYTPGVAGTFNLPSNFPYFRIVCGAAAADPQPVPSVDLCVKFQYIVTAYYTDA